MDADGQDVRHVGPKSDAAFAAASANQDWLVYTSRADGKFRLVKVPVKGVPAIQLTDVDSISPALSHYGKSVAYIVREKGQSERLGIISIDGGTP